MPKYCPNIVFHFLFSMILCSKDRFARFTLYILQNDERICRKICNSIDEVIKWKKFLIESLTSLKLLSGKVDGTTITYFLVLVGELKIFKANIFCW